MASAQIAMAAMDKSSPGHSPSSLSSPSSSSSSRRRNSLGVPTGPKSTSPRALNGLHKPSPSSSSSVPSLLLDPAEASEVVRRSLVDSFSLGRQSYLPLVTPAVERSEPFFHDHKVGTLNRKHRRKSMPASASSLAAAKMALTTADLDCETQQQRQWGRLFFERRDLNLPNDAVSRPLFNAIVSNLSTASSSAAGSSSDKAARVAADLLTLRRRSVLPSLSLASSLSMSSTPSRPKLPGAPIPISAADESPSSSSSSSSVQRRRMTTKAASDPALVASQRRASVRSQQLSLLASQARMVSVGSSSVKTAKRAEAVVKDVVLRAVEERRNSTLAADRELLAISDGTRSAPVSEPASPLLVSLGPTAAARRPTMIAPEDNSDSALLDPTKQWESVVSRPEMATAFMAGASELAKDWANGFYAYERSWAGDALRREKRRLSGEDEMEEGDPATADEVENQKRRRRWEGSESFRRRSDSICPAFHKPLSPLSAVKKAGRENEEEAKEQSINAAKKDDDDEGSTRSAEDTREAIDEVEESVESTSDVVKPATLSTVPAGGSVGLVGVLNEFASLLETRQEACQGLEKLARDASELANTRLEPLVRIAASAPPEVHSNSLKVGGEDSEDEEEEDDDDNEEAMVDEEK